MHTGGKRGAENERRQKRCQGLWSESLQEQSCLNLGSAGYRGGGCQEPSLGHVKSKRTSQVGILIREPPIFTNKNISAEINGTENKKLIEKMNKTQVSSLKRPIKSVSL